MESEDASQRLSRRIDKLSADLLRMRSGNLDLSPKSGVRTAEFKGVASHVVLRADESLKEGALGSLQIRASDGLPFRSLIQPVLIVLCSIETSSEVHVEAYFVMNKPEANRPVVDLGMNGRWAAQAQFVFDTAESFSVSGRFECAEARSPVNAIMLRVNPERCRNIGLHMIRVFSASNAPAVGRGVLK